MYKTTRYKDTKMNLLMYAGEKVYFTTSVIFVYEAEAAREHLVRPKLHDSRDICLSDKIHFHFFCVLYSQYLLHTLFKMLNRICGRFPMIYSGFVPMH